MTLFWPRLSVSVGTWKMKTPPLPALAVQRRQHRLPDGDLSNAVAEEVGDKGERRTKPDVRDASVSSTSVTIFSDGKLGRTVQVHGLVGERAESSTWP